MNALEADRARQARLDAYWELAFLAALTGFCAADALEYKIIVDHSRGVADLACVRMERGRT